MTDFFRSLQDSLTRGHMRLYVPHVPRHRAGHAPVLEPTDYRGRHAA